VSRPDAVVGTVRRLVHSSEIAILQTPRTPALPRHMPDEIVLSDAGASGERFVARIRLTIALLLLLIPISSTGGLREFSSENLVGLVMTLTTVLIAAVVYLLVRREQHGPALGYVTSVLDVTAVSTALALFLVQGHPHTAVNSKVVFETYFLAIGATCLRFDVRICILAGVLAMLQYFGICWYATTHFDLNGAQYVPFDYGRFDWATQVNRLILLGSATALSAAIVARGRDLRRLSTIDPLTNLANRNYFDERLAAELSRHSRSGLPFAVVMVDIDLFKTFNDRYGHAAGDEALRTLAATMRRTLRRSDLLARYGGEEFVILMPETSLSAACDKMETLRQLVMTMSVWVGREQTASTLTISAGVAGCPDDGATADALLTTADARLFHAKQAGRNMVTGGGASTSAPPPACRT